jgi:asparaginyl-tRNA synthetase
MNLIVSIAELAGRAGQNATLRGWLAGSRSGGKLVFLLVRDGSGLCQCVADASAPAAFEAARALTLECSLEVTGLVRADPRAPGGFELAVTNLRTIGTSPDYPITRKAHGIDFLLNHRHLWLRSRRPTAILKVRHTLIRAIRDFFDSRGFTLVDTPILIRGAAEGAATLFPVDAFGERAFLTQTGQLHLECACMALGKVYCFGPTFRAEKSKTRRHLAEFWMVEPEVAFAELDEVVALAEALVCHAVGAVLAERRSELDLLERDPAPLEKVRPPFPRLTYTQAVDWLRAPDTQARFQARLEEDRARLQEWVAERGRLETLAAGSLNAAKRDRVERDLAELRERIAELEKDLETRPAHLEQARTFPWGKDLGGSDETLLGHYADRPLCVTEYPAAVKAFYMKPSAADPRVVRNVDVLAPEGYGEIIGGSQREDDLDALTARMRAEGLNPEDYGWYLDLRRFGTVPHGGFGLGLERLVAWVCGLRHVREAIPFPRTLGRLEP